MVSPCRVMYELMLMEKPSPVILVNDVSRPCYIIIRPQVEKWKQMGVNYRNCVYRGYFGVSSFLFSL